MKKVLPYLLFLLVVAGCKKDDYIPMWFLIINDSGYDITLKSTKGEPSIELKKGERKEVATKFGLKYDIVPGETTTKVFEFRTGPSITTIISYDYKLEYLIEGTAERADIEYLTENRTTRTIKNVSLPAKYQFKAFCNCIAYISAARVGDTGAVTVTLLKRGKQVNQASSSSHRPATVSLNDWN
ncbi:hypothetical protein [Pontibacter russatus]|uniref:hypothetical protein n=1 Tax=Pontibacter russatus TaxID=2694929 RepID=UPI00137B13C3|nr:hypothetical protein [Pontibacter russatus]